ncbi:MAG: DUF3313 domain-containing protein [Gammaproteobacteria bacterium]
MNILFRIGIAALLLSLGACARTYQARYVETTDFLDDYSILEEDRDNDALLCFWKQDVDWSKYRKVMIEPVAIRKTANSELNRITHLENSWLKEFFEYRVRQVLKKDFKLVNRPGPDTLRIELAITDAETSTLLLDQFTTLYPSARALSLLKRLALGTESYVGKASIERKITDSSTGELLMASADARAGGKTLAGSFDDWDDVKQAYIYWANQLRYQLCEKKGLGHCQEPESGR